MEPRLVRVDARTEFATAERCSILESWNDPSDSAVSIARARVEQGVTTQPHCLDVDERYVIVEGRGVATIGRLPPLEVGPGDVVVIPAGTRQQIANVGRGDLTFYCVCSPRFQPSHFHHLEAQP